MTNKKKYIVFDLDDTLAQEIDFLKSAYANIANIIEGVSKDELFEQMLSLYEQKQNVFEEVVKRYPKFSVEGLLRLYRQHIPIMELNPGAKELLAHCKKENYRLGLLTDGRSITQRNKISALGIEELFDKIIISEEFGSTKPNPQNFLEFMEDESYAYYYIANDTNKDFIAPNQLNWTSICLLNSGNNIHDQNFDLEAHYLPTHRISNLIEGIGLV